jgi:hypothetical protein
MITLGIIIFLIVVAIVACVTYFLCFSWAAVLIAIVACVITAGVCLVVARLIKSFKKK